MGVCFYGDTFLYLRIKMFDNFLPKVVCDFVGHLFLGGGSMFDPRDRKQCPGEEDFNLDDNVDYNEDWYDEEDEEDWGGGFIDSEDHLWQDPWDEYDDWD